jgi:hypothetical protein
MTFELVQWSDSSNKNQVLHYLGNSYAVANDHSCLISLKILVSEPVRISAK